MKKIVLILLILIIYHYSSAQFVAKMQVKEPIPGICDDQEVYALFSSMKGQEQALCPLSKQEITNQLNSKVAFVKENPKYDDKGMIGLIINCKGELVKCEMDNKTKSPELDKQIEEIFKNLGVWKAGKLNNKTVDSSRLFSFTIKNGVFTLN